MQRRRTLATFLTLALAAACRSGPPDQEAADLILRNGRVYTLTWSDPAADGTPAPDAPHDGRRWHPDAEAVAVRAGRIVRVGSNRWVSELRGPRTRVADLGGSTVLPGLVDSHTHVVGLGELERQVDLVGVENEDEAIERLRAGAGDVGPGTWILARGWDEGAWAASYPTWDRLDEAFPDNPVLLDSLHGFAVWANRMAFEAAGVTRDTPDPPGGEILRDADGEPTGVVLNRAGRLLRDAVPAPSPAELEAVARAGLERMARDGFVAVHEAGVDADLLAAFEALEARGELPVRVYTMLSARDEELCRAWIERGPETESEERVITRSVKAYYDGALGSRGARLLDDYSDRPGHRGVAGDEYGFDQELVADMMRAGFQVGIHAIGDAGNREALDFIEGVVREEPEAQALRHRIEHAQVLHPADFPRFEQLDVIASMEPPHCVEDKDWAEERLGPDRARHAYAWRSLRKAGADLALNSDLAGSDHDIFYGLHAAITRRDRDLEPADGWHPEQALTPEEAVRGYTLWNARAAHLEEHTGTIEPGKWADLTVMDLDPLTVGSKDPAQLLEGKIIATIVAGEVVHLSSGR